jgi:hypothetical protein
MNLQYISDNKGKTTGVFIPIEEWEALKSKYKGLGDNPGIALDFDPTMDDIEKEL